MYKKIVVILILLPLVPTLLVAFTQLEKSQRLTTQTNKTLLKTQSKINTLDDKSTIMLAEYNLALRELENYKIYNRQLQGIVNSQHKEMASIKKQSQDVEVTKRHIMPLMEKMIEVLELFVQKDRPFLLKERKQRIASLKANMKRADISIASKYRQILESYQIEIDYGKTIEAYKGIVDGINVSFLKVGRIGLYYQTRDKSETAVWSTRDNKWQILHDSDYDIAISKGLKIATKQRSPELFFIAVEQEKDRK